MRTRGIAAPFFLVLFGSGILVHAAAARVTPVAAAPAGVPDGMSAALGAGLEAKVDPNTSLEIWPAKSLSSGKESTALGVHYGGIREGEFVGLVRLKARWRDSKGQAIAPGIYTLRYAIQPADGNHMGVSEYRDFLLLSPVSADADPTALPERDAFYGSSRKVAGTRHPAVMSLVIVPDGAPVPGAFDLGEGGAAVAVRAGTRTLGIVVRGGADGEAGR